MNHKLETWKDIRGYEGFYQVSDLGNVRSIDRTTKTSDGREYFQGGKILQPVKSKCGYLYVNLRKNGKLTSRTIHRLVAEHFLPNPLSKPQVNHIDEKKENNNVSNLAWVTVKENANYGNRNYKVSESRKQKVIVRNQELNKEIVFQSLSEARRFFNVKGNGTVVYGKAFNRGKMKGWIIEKCDKDIV